MKSENCPYFYRKECKLYEHRNSCLDERCGIFKMQENIELLNIYLGKKDNKINEVQGRTLYLLRIILNSKNGIIKKYKNTYVFTYKNGNELTELPVDCTQKDIDKYFFDIDLIA